MEKWALASTKQAKERGMNTTSWTKRILSNAEKNKKEVLDILDSQLLSWLDSENIEDITAEDIEELFGATMASIQSLNLSKMVTIFKEALLNRSRFINSNITNSKERNLYSITGFSIDSNRNLHSIARGISTAINEYEGLQKLSREIWIDLFEDLTKLPELSMPRSITADVFADWVEGIKYDQIADNHFDNNIENAVKNIEKITYLLPWALHGLIQHVIYQGIAEEDLPKILHSIPSMVQHGVPTIAATIMSSIGIQNRQASSRFGEIWYEQNLGETPNILRIRSWLVNLELGIIDSVVELVPSITKEEILFILSKYERREDSQTLFNLNLIILDESGAKILKEASLEDLMVLELDSKYLILKYD